MMAFYLGKFTLIINDSVALYGPERASGTSLWIVDPWNRLRFLNRYPECADRLKNWPLTRILLAFRKRPSLKQIRRLLGDRPRALAGGYE